jgi:nitrogen regulatory protein P-II 2
MTLHSLKQVTIVCEALSREAVLAVLEDEGARGWTIATVEGQGPGGARGGEIPELANLRLEVLLQPAVAAMVLERLERDLFPRYAMIAWETDVRVLRPARF